MKVIQAAIYARVSSEQQAAAHTIESQLAALAERARIDGTPCRQSDGLSMMDTAEARSFVRGLIGCAT